MDNLTKGGDSVKEKDQIKNRIVSILDNQVKTLDQLDEHIIQYKQKESQLEEEVKMKTLECESLEKRLKNIDVMRPKIDNDQIQLEIELQNLFRIYSEKVRNHDYMENKLDQFNAILKKKEEIEQKELLKAQLLNAEQQRNLFNDVYQDIDENSGDEDKSREFDHNNYKEKAKNKNNMRDQNHTRTNKRDKMNNFANDDEDELVEEEEEAEDDDRI